MIYEGHTLIMIHIEVYIREQRDLHLRLGLSRGLSLAAPKSKQKVISRIARPALRVPVCSSAPTHGESKACQSVPRSELTSPGNAVRHHIGAPVPQYTL